MGIVLNPFFSTSFHTSRMVGFKTIPLIVASSNASMYLCFEVHIELKGLDFNRNLQSQFQIFLSFSWNLQSEDHFLWFLKTSSSFFLKQKWSLVQFKHQVRFHLHYTQLNTFFLSAILDYSTTPYNPRYLNNINFVQPTKTTYLHKSRVKLLILKKVISY